MTIADEAGGHVDELEAREVKAQMVDFTRQLAERVVRPSDAAGTPPLALGLARQPDGSYRLAVRYRLGLSSVRSVARKVADKVGPRDVDVRRTGRIRTLAPPTGGDRAEVRLRPPVARAQSVGETGRVRPLRPGVSIGHVRVSAGTLGAFVHVDGAVHVLSNYHVLSGSPAAAVGDVVVQPAVADGGTRARDRVGTLAARVELEPNGRATVDCAIARLDEEVAEPDTRYPVGRVTTTTAVLGGESVGKIGRTTAVTQGRITAFEVDDVVVGYGDELGEVTFDNQIEVESTGPGPFSRGGDSGALVYRDDGVAIGLLFAGAESGGENGSGLTYVNPIDAVLAAWGATLV